MNRITSWCSDCAPPYGFRNHYQLSDNVSEFKVSLLLLTSVLIYSDT